LAGEQQRGAQTRYGPTLPPDSLLTLDKGFSL